MPTPDSVSVNLVGEHLLGPKWTRIGEADVDAIMQFTAAGTPPVTARAALARMMTAPHQKWEDDELHL